MSEEKRSRYFVTNHQNQPVELHLATGVMVLGFMEEAEVQEDDLAIPQLRVLQANRLIAVTTHAPVETPSEALSENTSSNKKADGQDVDRVPLPTPGGASESAGPRSRGRRNPA